jgi:hypothetical protein
VPESSIAVADSGTPNNDPERAERLASFDPTVAALVLASPPLSPERRDRLRVIFGAAS